jgi:hypothetical protein
MSLLTAYPRVADNSSREGRGVQHFYVSLTSPGAEMCNKKKCMRGGAYSTSFYASLAYKHIPYVHPGAEMCNKKTVSKRMAEGRIGCRKEAFAKFALKIMTYGYIRCSNPTSQPGALHQTPSNA